MALFCVCLFSTIMVFIASHLYLFSACLGIGRRATPRLPLPGPRAVEVSMYFSLLLERKTETTQFDTQVEIMLLLLLIMNVRDEFLCSLILTARAYRCALLRCCTRAQQSICTMASKE